MARRDTVPASRHSRFRVFLYAAFGIIGVFLLAALGAVIYFTREYNQILNLQKEVATGYADLSQKYEFEPPASSAELTSPDWHAMLDSRQAALATISEPERRRILSLLDVESLSAVGPTYYMDLLALAPIVKELTDAHRAALEQAQMSPEHYMWLTGLAVRDAMAQAPPDGDSPYWGLLQQAERLSKSDDNPGNDITADMLYEDIRSLYDDSMKAPPAALEGLGHSDPVSALADLLVIGALWAQANDVEIPTIPERQ